MAPQTIWTPVPRNWRLIGVADHIRDDDQDVCHQEAKLSLVGF